MSSHDLKEALEYKLREDLKFSKSTYLPWGRLVIRAIDFDDCAAMCKVFEEKRELGANVDEQSTSENYGGHTWTAWITSFVGDTALHMALRQNKMKCVYMLIAMGACVDIENCRGQTAEDMIRDKGLKLRQLELDAFREVIPQIDPTTFRHLPKRSPHTAANFPSVEREAWDLMEQGRNMYQEVPACFAYDDIIPDVKKFKEKPRKWATRFDAKTQRKYRIDAYTGDIEWLAHEPKKKVINTDASFVKAPPSSKKEWTMAFDESGKKYYYNTVSGESQWETPDEMKSKTQLEAEAKERRKQERREQGLPEDSDEEYSYKKDGESDSDDEEAKIQALRAQREREETEKAEAATREERERKIAEREQWSRENQAKRKAQRKHEIETGINICSGAVATGDVYSKNRVTDMIRLLHKQKVRQQRENEAEAHRLSGLTLMDAAAKGEKPGLSTQLLKGLRDLKGVQRLKFGRYQELRKLANELEESPDPRADLALPYRYITILSTRTNLKAMAVSDFGLEGMSKELVDDRYITIMSLFSAGVSLRGCEALALTLPTMRSLTCLDLSGNAIDDAAAQALARGLCVSNEGSTYFPFKDADQDHAAVAARKAKFGSLEGHLPLIKLSLAGNRLTLPGAKAIVEAALDIRSTIRLVSLTNNFLRTAEKEQLANIAGPHYDHTRGQQRYAKRYEFPGPGGRVMKWPFHIYPFPRHPMHPKNNPTEDQIKYYIKYQNGGKPLSGVMRGSATPERGEWEPLELRQRYADRARAKRERAASRPREKLERRAMNDEDDVKHLMSEAAVLAMEEKEEAERLLGQGGKEEDEDDEEEEGGEGEGVMVPPSNLYSEDEIVRDPALALELAALKEDPKVTSMSKKNEKVLRESPRGRSAEAAEDTNANPNVSQGIEAGTDEVAVTMVNSPARAAGGDTNTPQSALSTSKRQSMYIDMSKGSVKSRLDREPRAFETIREVNKLATTGGTASGRKIRFEDEGPAYTNLDEVDEAEGKEIEEAHRKREEERFEIAFTNADKHSNVSDFGQEVLQPGQRGPPHLRELDILF